MQLLKHSAVYGLGSIASKLMAILLLPLYVRYLDPSDYGTAEAVMTIDLFTVALVKLGLQNSMMRFYFDGPDDDGGAHGRLVVRTVLTTMLATTIVGSLILVVASRPLAEFFFRDASMYHFIWIAAFGMWCSTIWSTLTATLRLEKRPKPFALLSLANIGTSALLTVLFVVVLQWGATGLLLGNFLGTFVLIPVVGILQRHFVRLSRGRGLLGDMIRFGLPTTPMAIANQGLSMIDRTVLARTAGLTSLGLYGLASRMSQVVMLCVIALQLSWQPFAYSLKDDDDAKKTYALVMTYFTASIGWLVVTVGLLADPVVRLLTVPEYFEAARAVPVLTLSAGVYGIYFIAGIGAGRVKKTNYHFAVALAALVVSLTANLLLVPRWGYMGSACAALAANATLSFAMVVRSQHVFPVPYHWRRLATTVLVVAAGVSLALLLPHGPGTDETLPIRLGAACAYPLILLGLGFFPRTERRAIVRRLRRRNA